MISAIKNPIAASFSQALVFGTSLLFCAVADRGREPYAMGAVIECDYQAIEVSFLFAAVYFFTGGVIKLMKKTRQMRVQRHGIQ